MFQVGENPGSPSPSLLMVICLHCQLDVPESVTVRRPVHICWD